MRLSNVIDESQIIVSLRNETTNTTARLQCELISDFSRLQELSADWERLWNVDPRPEIFQSFEWARVWWQSYGSEFTLSSLAVFENEHVIGIVPLVKHGDKILFLGGQQSDYCDILCEEHRTTEVLSSALETLLQIPGWKECLLVHVKAESCIGSHWRTLPRQLLDHLQLVPANSCHTIRLDQNREATLCSLLGKCHTRRRLNKLKKAGRITFRHIETKAEAQEHLSSFFQHQIRRRALLGKECTSGTKQFHRFLRALVEELDLTDRLRFGVLELEGRPLAWHFNFHVNGKFVLYQHAFDVDAWDYAPGEVLLNQFLLFARENMVRELDFGQGDEPYKVRFATHTRETYTLHVDHPGFEGRVRRLLRSSCGPLRYFRRHIRRVAIAHEPTFRAFRSIRLWWAKLRIRVQRWRRNKTLAARTSRAIFKLSRPALFRRAEIDMFVPDARCKTHAAHPRILPSTGLKTREGRFSDLVDLALRRSEIIAPSELQRYRQRFRKGDRVYMLGQGDEIVLVAWTGMRKPEDILGLKPDQRILQHGTAMLLYECWPVSGTDEVCQYQELLEAVSDEAINNKLLLAVCCPAESSSLRMALTLQGFRPQYRIIRHRGHRRSRVDFLQSPPASDHAPSTREPATLPDN